MKFWAGIGILVVLINVVSAAIHTFEYIITNDTKHFAAATTNVVIIVICVALLELEKRRNS